MAEITIHNANLKISYENPENSLSTGIQNDDGTIISLFFTDVEQWWAVRSALQKCSEYFLSSGSVGRAFITDHDKADAWAREFYEREKVRLLTSKVSHREKIMETHHTPGPWAVIPPICEIGEDGVPTGAFSDPGGIEGADGNPVCIFGDQTGSGTMFENEADRPLIAAAPELLTAAKKAEFFIAGFEGGELQEGIGKLLAQVRAAIAKAEGRA